MKQRPSNNFVMLVAKDHAGGKDHVGGDGSCYWRRIMLVGRIMLVLQDDDFCKKHFASKN